jgi:hypothetical protein
MTDDEKPTAESMRADIKTRRKTLSEELHERINLRPDKWTLAWWNSRFDELVQSTRGMSHTLNKLVQSVHEQWQELKILRTATAAANIALQAEVEAANVEIGRLNSEVAALSARMGKMAAWAKAKDAEKMTIEKDGEYKGKSNGSV